MNCGGLIVCQLVCGGAPEVSPSPPQIREAARQVIANGPYRIEVSDYYGFDMSWLFDALREFFELLFSPLSHAPWPLAAAIVIVLMVILIFLLAHIAYSFFSNLRRPESQPVQLVRDALPDPNALERRAEELAAASNYVDATRTLFQAALTRLERKRGGRILASLTNSEYLRTFKSPWVIENLRVFVELLNWKWYRDRRFEENDYLQCKGAYAALIAQLGQET